MRATTLIAATTAVAVLGLAPAARADRYSAQYSAQYPAQYPDRHSNRGYSDRDDSNRYPDRGQMERVQVLAHELEETADWIHREAERNNRRPNRAEARMLAELHELDGRATRFHREVESYRQNPRHTEAEFRALLEAYDDTWDALAYTGRRSYIDRGMNRIDNLLRDLSRYYGRSRDFDRRRGAGWDRYNRGDHNGRDRRYDGRP